jgi:hypothetical protein
VPKANTSGEGYCFILGKLGDQLVKIGFGDV